MPQVNVTCKSFLDIPDMLIYREQNIVVIVEETSLLEKKEGHNLPLFHPVFLLPLSLLWSIIKKAKEFAVSINLRPRSTFLYKVRAS